LPADLVLARVIHIFGAVVWVGGMIFLVTVAVPYARTLPAETRGATIGAIGRRFRPVGWAALAMLVGSGLYQMARMRLLGWDALTTTGYGRLLLAKIVLVTVILGLVAVHDFVLGPRLRKGEGSRTLLVLLARANLALTLAVPVIGVVLAH
jgi:uncharacterized membrane protein